MVWVFCTFSVLSLFLSLGELKSVSQIDTCSLVPRLALSGVIESGDVALDEKPGMKLPIRKVLSPDFVT